MKYIDFEKLKDFPEEPVLPTVPELIGNVVREVLVQILGRQPEEKDYKRVTIGLFGGEIRFLMAWDDCTVGEFAYRMDSNYQWKVIFTPIQNEDNRAPQEHAT